MTHHTIRRRLAVLALLPITLVATSEAHGTTADSAVIGMSAWPPPIAWAACPNGTLPEAISTFLAYRLECGSMVALVANTGEPANVHAGVTDIGLVRVKAGNPSRRLGTLFFNIGGPGGNPTTALPEMVYVWSTSGRDGMRRLAEQYDVVAVIPRGVKGSGELSCPTFDEPDPRIGANDDAQWQATLSTYGNAVRRCTAWQRQFMGTMNHVGDMEQARLALGEPTLNFLGTSYGTWVGAAYAATYPGHTGRMVLDSAMDYSGTFEAQIEAANDQQQADFNLNVIQPLASDPRFGLGNDASAILARLRQWPLPALSDLAPLIATPEDFVAALALVEISPGGDMAPHELRERLKNHRFNADATLDDAIRAAALAMAPQAFSSFPADESGDAGLQFTDIVNPSVYETVVCGDTPWPRTTDALRAKAMSHAFLYPAATPASIEMGLLCHSWRFPRKLRPSLAQLEKAPPLFIVQAEFDPATPLALATKAFHASPGAYMMVAEGVQAHGILVGLAAPCVEDAASHFLLTGELPATRFTTCKPAPRQPRAAGRDASRNTVADEALRRLRGALRHL